MKAYSVFAFLLFCGMGNSAQAQIQTPATVHIKRIVIHAFVNGQNIPLNQYEPLNLKLDDRDVDLTFKAIDTDGNDYRLAAKFAITNPEFLSATLPATFGNTFTQIGETYSPYRLNVVLHPLSPDWFGVNGVLYYSLDLPPNYRLEHGAQQEGSIAVYVSDNAEFAHAKWVVDGAYKALLLRPMAKGDGLGALRFVKNVMRGGLSTARSTAVAISTSPESLQLRPEGGAFARVGNLYRHLLRRQGTDLDLSRDPHDGPAFNRWVREYSAGRISLSQMVSEFVNSPEYAAKNGY